MRLGFPTFALAAALLWTPLCADAQDTPGDIFARGYRHLTGRGATRDATRAAACFLEAARLGDPQAQFRLGVLFMDGLGVPRDIQWAWFWLNRAHDHPDLPDTARQLAQGRLATATLLLTTDQKKRLGIK